MTMLERYEKYLEELDKYLQKCFEEHKEFIFCSKGCSGCCEVGEYPFSRLEMEYLMQGFLQLPQETRKSIRAKISATLEKRGSEVNKAFSYSCPFLQEGKCSLYERRGIICRTFGLAYLENDFVRLPECANSGLNYSKVYNPETKELILENPIRENLSVYKLSNGSLSTKYNLEFGEIRPLIEWFNVTS